MRARQRDQPRELSTPPGGLEYWWSKSTPARKQLTVPSEHRPENNKRGQKEHLVKTAAGCLWFFYWTYNQKIINRVAFLCTKTFSQQNKEGTSPLYAFQRTNIYSTFFQKKPRAYHCLLTLTVNRSNAQPLTNTVGARTFIVGYN